MSRVLKSLELVGFKSFAQRTVFDFSHGITAIVGPNGSGKSNVIDAIRWLLGEREARNLRGAKAEDLVFAGTVQRARLGQAQATFHFENSSGFFPVDYAEVAITRQVNRDGENKYYLNKSEIRLKDLIDLFAAARLGAKGFTVVSQGNSDVFVQANPSSRREMIEEMLGLREYQLKRAEAERRLRNTALNLDKVRALTDEILPHLRSLRRQAGKWERREELGRELRELEDRLFGSERAEIARGMSALDAELAVRAGRARELEAERGDAEEKLKSVENGHPESRKEIKAVRERIAGLLDRKNQLQKDVGRLEARIEIGQTDVPGGHEPPPGMLTELVRRVRMKLEELCADEIDYEDLRSALLEIIDDIDEGLGARREVEERDAPGIHGAIAEELERATRSLAGLDAELRELSDQEAALEKGQEQFYADFKRAVTSLETAKDRWEEWHTGTREREFERQRFMLRREEWERRVREAGRSPEEWHASSSEATDLDGEREQIEKRIYKLRGDLAAIGEIDDVLLREARDTEERYGFLSKESDDLEKAREDLRKLILELNEKIKSEFGKALGKINQEFERFFSAMFGGGTAKLKIVKRDAKTAKVAVGAGAGGGDASGETQMVAESTGATGEDESVHDAEVEEGIEIDVKLPRKRATSLDMLSGGERSLVGIAALFALISVSPPPFLVLDEIDAALDDRNARRFADMLTSFAQQTQFVIVTHNRATMEAADILYGVTMSDDATSRVVSLKLASRT